MCPCMTIPMSNRYFYGIALETNDDSLFPHLVDCPTSDHSSFVRYLSSNGVVVRFGYERVEPVLHVTLQPVLWDDRRPSFFLRNAADVKELEHMAKEVYEITNTKIMSSMSDSFFINLIPTFLFKNPLLSSLLLLLNYNQAQIVPVSLNYDYVLYLHVCLDRSRARCSSFPTTGMCLWLRNLMASFYF